MYKIVYKLHVLNNEIIEKKEGNDPMPGSVYRTWMYERKIEEALEWRLKEIKEEILKDYKGEETYKEWLKKLENLSK